MAGRTDISKKKAQGAKWYVVMTLFPSGCLDDNIMNHMVKTVSSKPDTMSGHHMYLDRDFAVKNLDDVVRSIRGTGERPPVDMPDSDTTIWFVRLSWLNNHRRLVEMDSMMLMATETLVRFIKHMSNKTAIPVTPCRTKGGAV